MDHVVTIVVYAVKNPTFYGRHLQTPDFVLKRARWNTQIVLKDRYLRLSAVRRYAAGDRRCHRSGRDPDHSGASEATRAT